MYLLSHGYKEKRYIYFSFPSHFFFFLLNYIQADTLSWRQYTAISQPPFDLWQYLKALSGLPKRGTSPGTSAQDPPSSSSWDGGYDSGGIQPASHGGNPAQRSLACPAEHTHLS